MAAFDYGSLWNHSKLDSCKHQQKLVEEATEFSASQVFEKLGVSCVLENQS